MRTALLSGLFVAIGFAATAQLTLLPQVGFENSKTNISFNDLSSFSPLGVKFSPQVSLRMDYRFKQGHGPWLGVSTSRSTVSYSFSNPESAMNIYSATAGDMQVRIEGGYMYSFKPVYFNRGNSQKQTTASSSVQQRTSNSTTTARKSCGSQKSTASRSHCSQNKSSYSYYSGHCNSSGEKQKLAKKEKGTWMRIQPLIGMGYVPSMPSTLVTKTGSGQTTYEYAGGNWNTALLAGTGFEFGRKNQVLFNVSLNYFKGLGNLEERSITTVSGTKTTTTRMNSEASGWNMKVGIPFTLAKKPAVRATQQRIKKDCGQYRIQYRCTQKIRI